jgi:uncharacterized SAM-binding protein YcdF (DUF218 family)
MRPSHRKAVDRTLQIVCRCLGAAVALVCLAALTPLPNYLALALRPEPRLEAADAIVVLGGGVEPDGALSPESLPRVMQGIRLYKARLAPLIVFSGAAFDDRPAEAEVAARLARDLGVPSEQILTEAGARTTREEAARIARRLEPRAVRRILLVTDSDHLTRAVPLFERVGFDVLPASADSVSSATRSPEERLQLLRRLSQELMARLYYRLAGYL